ncbi:hypothetical protein ACIQWY_29905 [Streptomyces albidoflavus]
MSRPGPGRRMRRTIVQSGEEALLDTWLLRAARLMGHAVVAAPGVVLLWVFVSESAAVLYLLLEALQCVGRSHFVDVGRFTAGVWPVTPSSPPVLAGIGWVRHGDGRAGPKAGVQVVLCNVVMAVFAYMPRDMWAEYRKDQAKARARKGDGGS